MPWKPSTPCSWPGCPELSPRRFCAEHQRQENRRYAAKRRARGADRVYGGKWRKVRRVVLAEEPLCRICREAGRSTPAADVDHIVPWRRGGALYALENLQPVCRPCHAAKTARERTDGR